MASGVMPKAFVKSARTTSAPGVTTLPGVTVFTRTACGATSIASVLLHEAIVEQASAILGGVDILVNNAASGRIYPGGSVTISDSGWQDCLNTNFFSAMRLTAALLPAMLERKSGAHSFEWRDDPLFVSEGGNECCTPSTLLTSPCIQAASAGKSSTSSLRKRSFEGKALPELAERVTGNIGKYREWLVDFILAHGIDLSSKKASLLLWGSATEAGSFCLPIRQC
jgi:hypothetical protein